MHSSTTPENLLKFGEHPSSNFWELVAHRSTTENKEKNIVKIYSPPGKFAGGLKKIKRLNRSKP